MESCQRALRARSPGRLVTIGAVSRTVVVRWKDWSGEGLEHLVLQERADGISAESLVLSPPEDAAVAARYRIVCDPGWRVLRLEVSLVDGARRIELSSDGAGRWADRAGTPRPDLAGAIDVDLSATPFTNTLPIRRLGLEARPSRDHQRCLRAVPRSRGHHQSPALHVPRASAALPLRVDGLGLHP